MAGKRQWFNVIGYDGHEATRWFSDTQSKNGTMIEPKSPLDAPAFGGTHVEMGVEEFCPCPKPNRLVHAFCLPPHGHSGVDQEL